MITKAYVSGFKSLSDFSIDLRPGLNILVGPNGSGKTNVILFFEFLSHLSTIDISESVSKLGGAGSIFTKIGDEEYGRNIRGTIIGCIKNGARDYNPNYDLFHGKPLKQRPGEKYILYEYSFDVAISKDDDLVYFKNQRLKIEFSPKYITSYDPEKDIRKWNLDISQDIDESAQLISLINVFDNTVKIRDYFSDGKIEEKDTASVLENFLNSSGEKSVSLLSQLDRFFRFSNVSLKQIQRDLAGGEIFNIIPSRVKQPEDIAGKPGILKDGSGLATTLLAMKKDFGRKHTVRSSSSAGIYSEKMFKTVVRYVQLANESIKDIEVYNNSFNNQIVVKIIIQANDVDNVSLPLSLMSDGTIKWLALITAIFTSKSIFSIEEPENFLHPWMQKEIVTIMRSAFPATQKKFALMSTHSETLLNVASPKEVIVISMKEGITSAKKVKNPKKLESLIGESGFGLGHLYISNALEN